MHEIIIEMYNCHHHVQQESYLVIIHLSQITSSNNNINNVSICYIAHLLPLAPLQHLIKESYHSVIQFLFVVVVQLLLCILALHKSLCLMEFYFVHKTLAENMIHL